MLSIEMECKFKNLMNNIILALIYALSAKIRYVRELINARSQCIYLIP